MDSEDEAVGEDEEEDDEDGDVGDGILDSAPKEANKGDKGKACCRY